MRRGTLSKEKHSWKFLINFPHILFPSHFYSPSSWNRPTGEELIDYIGLKKVMSLQFACHINYKQTSPSPKYTNSVSMLVPTRTALQNNILDNRSNLVSVLFLPFDFRIPINLSLCFRAKNHSAGAGLLPPHTDWSQHLA